MKVHQMKSFSKFENSRTLTENFFRESEEEKAIGQICSDNKKCWGIPSVVSLSSGKLSQQLISILK